MLKHVIEQFARKNGVKEYSLKNFYLPYANWANGIEISSNAYAFFYSMHLSGVINFATDLSKQLAVFKSENERIDYAQVSKVRFYDPLTVMESDFIWYDRGFIKIELPTAPNAIFNKVFNGAVEYCLMTIHAYGEPNTEATQRINIFKNA